MLRAGGGCLGTGSRRRARQAAIIRGEGHTPDDPRAPEWENPARREPGDPAPEHIGRGRQPGELKHLSTPRKRNQIEIPLVVASERGPRANLGGPSPPGVVGPSISPVTKAKRSGTAWEGRRNRVRAPYADRIAPARRHPSTAGHVKPGGKLGGPPSNPEYSPVTDSAPVPRGKGEKHPGRGVKQYLKPPAYKQSEHLFWCDGVPFVE